MKKLKHVGVVGYVDPDWIAKQVRLEDNVVFAQSVHYVPQAKPITQTFAVGSTIKQAFAASFDFISSLPKL